jgi:valyl-tRNA synthetase
MSKSLKNYAAAPEVLNKSGADAVRQWAAGGGATGSDIPYRVQDVEYGRRFLVKLWNASGFASNLLADYDPKITVQPDYQLLDKWILSKTENITKKVTESYERCQFNIAIEDIRNFTWHVFCDFYVEAVKDRLYRPEAYGQGNAAAAQKTLYEVLYRMLQLLAPVVPHMTEEIYQYMYKDGKGYQSIQVSEWHKFNAALVDEAAERDGDLVTAVMSEIRRDKAENKKPLNAPIKNLTVTCKDESATQAIHSAEADIKATLKIEDITIKTGAGEGRQVAQYEVYINPQY